MLERQQQKDTGGVVLLRGTRKEVTGWRPVSRENGRLGIVQGKLYLYGGICSEMIDEVATYDLASGRWQQVQTKGNTALMGRIGHSAHLYSESELLIFGGQSRQREQAKGAVCLNDTRILDTSTLIWSQLRTIGTPVEARRNHASCLVGQQLVVLGGVATHNHYLSDLVCLDLESNKWTKSEYS